METERSKKNFDMMDARLGQTRSSKIAFKWTEIHLISFYVELKNVLSKNRLWALILCRMAYGCFFKVLKYIFGALQSLATQAFDKVIRVPISSLYV